jgi:hypothetical protein
MVNMVTGLLPGARPVCYAVGVWGKVALSSAEAKNVWSYIGNPQYIFVVWYLDQCRGSFI